MGEAATGSGAIDLESLEAVVVDDVEVTGRVDALRARASGALEPARLRAAIACLDLTSLEGSETE